MIESLVDDKELRRVCRRLKRPPRKPGRSSCSGCGNGNSKGSVDVNELKRWMVEVIGDDKRDLIKKKFGTDTLEVRYRNKRGNAVSVKL
jgi:hypothetical protein